MFLAVTVMLGDMTYTEKERRGIAEAVRRTRLARNLDKEPAARAAKVNSITWKRVEDAETVRDASLGKILASLGLPNAEALVRGPWPDPTASAPEEPADYLQEVDFAARAIKLIGDQLLAAIPEPFISDVAKALSELAEEYAQTLLAAVEENPVRRGRFSEPYTAAVVAARHFRASVDSLGDHTKPPLSAHLGRDSREDSWAGEHTPRMGQG